MRYLVIILTFLMLGCTSIDKKKEFEKIRDIFHYINEIEFIEKSNTTILTIREKDYRLDSNFIFKKSQYMSYYFADLFGVKDSLIINFILENKNIASVGFSPQDLNLNYKLYENNNLYKRMSEYSFKNFDGEDFYNVRNSAYWLNRVNVDFESPDYFFYLFKISDSSDTINSETEKLKRQLRAIFLLCKSSGYECIWDDCDKEFKMNALIDKYNKLASFYDADSIAKTDSLLIDNGVIIY